MVIVGGGFGGLAAARKLRRADVQVTVVDRMDHHLFQPLLYEVATGGMSTGECATPIRAALRRSRNASVLMAEATGLDVERRRLVLDRGDHLDYDSLIVATGAQTSYFGNDGWADVSCGLKTLNDAVEIRNRVVGAFEEAERTSDPAVREQWMTFVVVGGGPTGVELAGSLAIIARHTIEHDYSRIRPQDAQIILLDAGERLVPSFSERLSSKVAQELASLGVTVREQARATAIDGEGVTVAVESGNERIPSRTVVWAAGVCPAEFTGVLARATSAETDRGGRIRIEPDLTVPGHPEISAIGDMAALAGPDGGPLPGLATVAIQQADHIAHGIRRGAAGALTPFRYLDKGALAVVGRGKAVCAVRGIEFSGRPAFAMYFGVHLYYLSGIPGRRLKVLTDMISARLGDRQNLLMVGELESLARPPASASAGASGDPAEGG